jgi:hypothetical protein
LVLLHAVVARTAASHVGRGGSKPCFDVQPGDRVAITVVDVDTFGLPAGKNPYDSGRAGTCGFGFDVSKGEVLVTKDVRNVSANGECLGAIAQVDGFGGWTWTLATDNSNSETATSSILFVVDLKRL